MTEPFSTPFVTLFESLGMSARFQRGRRDARAGHVRHLSISSSLVTAQVRGPEEPQTERARIAVRAFGAAAWARIEDDLAAEARYVAELLAGRLPDGIDEVLARAGLRLLPDSIDDVAMDCTCGQWPMPCGHLAATCYALARSFDTDPFGALTWRGRSRDDLLTRLHDIRAATAHAASAPAPTATAGPSGVGPAGAVPSGVGLPGAGPYRAGPAGAVRSDAAAAAAGLGDPDMFWGAGASTTPAEADGPAATGWTGDAPGGAAGPGGSRRTDALLDELDPLTIGDRPVTELLRPAYQALAPDRTGSP